MKLVILSILILTGSTANVAVCQTRPSPSDHILSVLIYKPDSVDMGGLVGKRPRLHSYLWAIQDTLYSITNHQEVIVSRSVDAGATWSTLYISAVGDSNNIASMSSSDWSPNGQYIALAFNNGRILFSANKGVSFSEIKSPTINNIRSVTVNNSGRITLGRVLASTLVSSEDSGETWLSEGLERYAPPYPVSFRYLNYHDDGKLYFSFIANTLNRLLVRDIHGQWEDVNIPFMVVTLETNADGTLLASASRRIGADYAVYTEMWKQSGGYGDWDTVFSFTDTDIGNRGLPSQITDIKRSPYGNVVAAVGTAAIFLNFDSASWTLEVKSAEIYLNKPNDVSGSNLTWTSPTRLHGSALGRLFTAELQQAVSVSDSEHLEDRSVSTVDESTMCSTVYSIEGRLLYEGTQHEVRTYIGMRQGCFAVTSTHSNNARMSKSELLCH
ncbi:MAG: hypothetical protein SGJ05_01485 [bacterium]|nr:hypothetical protein [bacterium]